MKYPDKTNRAHPGFKGSSQRGFTLVEIMLAITLSLILIAGVIQVYASSKTSFLIQGQLSRFQENQRIAVEFLQRDIRLAGFSNPGQAPINPADKIVVTEGVNGASDQITVQFDSATDCLGQATPGGRAVNNYFIFNGVDVNNMPINQLMCLGNGSDTPLPIADGISNMQILVGEDVLNNNVSTYSRQLPSADRYVNAGLVTNPNQIVSVRVALLVESSGAIRTTGTNQTYAMLDTLVNNFSNGKNNRVKMQVVTTTIPRRN